MGRFTEMNCRVPVFQASTDTWLLALSGIKKKVFTFQVVKNKQGGIIKKTKTLAAKLHIYFLPANGWFFHLFFLFLKRLPQQTARQPF